MSFLSGFSISSYRANNLSLLAKVLLDSSSLLANSIYMFLGVSPISSTTSSICFIACPIPFFNDGDPCNGSISLLKFILSIIFVPFISSIFSPKPKVSSLIICMKFKLLSFNTSIILALKYLPLLVLIPSNSLLESLPQPE